MNVTRFDSCFPSVFQTSSHYKPSMPFQELFEKQKDISTANETKAETGQPDAMDVSDDAPAPNLDDKRKVEYVFNRGGLFPACLNNTLYVFIIIVTFNAVLPLIKTFFFA